MLVLLFLLGISLSTGPADLAAYGKVPGDLSTIRLLALEPVAGYGVLELPDGERVLVEEGEPLPDTGATVVEVLEDRLVLREELGGTPRRRRILWMFPVNGAGSSSVFRILDPVPSEEGPTTKPQDSSPRQDDRTKESV